MRKFGMLFQGARAVRQPAGLGERRLRPDPGPRHGPRRRRKRDRAATSWRRSAWRRGRRALSRPSSPAACRSAWPGPRHRRRAGDHLLRRADHRPRPDHGRRDQRPDRQMRAATSAPPRSRSPTTWPAPARSPTASPCSTTAGSSGPGPAGEIDDTGNAYVDQFVHGRADGPIQMHGRGRWRSRALGDGRKHVRAALSSARPAAPAMPQWAGRCEACGDWNTIVEEAPRRGRARRRSARQAAAARRRASSTLAGATSPSRRGASPASPSSTASAAAAWCRLGHPDRRRSRHRQVDPAAAGRGRARRSRRACAYISGEEAVDQVRLRARRLGLADAPVELAAATNVRDIVAALDAAGRARRSWSSIRSRPCGSTRSTARPARSPRSAPAAAELIRLAKRRGFALVLVGHVTKDGADRRPARARAHGRRRALFRRRARPPVPHPARGQEPLRRHRRDRRLRDDRCAAWPRCPTRRPCSWPNARGDVAGAAVFAGIEGTRPVLVEIQALVAPSPLGTPRRAVVGWDSGRLAMVLAVLEARCGLAIGDQRRLSQRRRRPADRRAGGRPGGRGRPASRPLTGAPVPPTRWCSARSACPARSARSARPTRG